MAQNYSTDDLKTLFTYPFQDPEWKNKFLIGSLIMLSAYVIPLFPFILIYGYMAEIMRKVINQGEMTLPAWDNWGKLFTDGLKLLGAVFIYSLPMFLFAFVGFGVFFFSIGIAAGNAESGGSPAAAASILGMLAMFATIGLMMLFGLGLGLLIPVIISHLVARNQFGAAFRVNEWWAILRANVGGFTIAYVLILALSMVLSFSVSMLYFTIILCCIVPFLMAPIMFYLVIIQGAIFAQAYRDGVKQLNAAPEAL